MTKLFHVSDVHFGAEDPGALAWFQDCVDREKPDAVMMTGDLTMRARRREFTAGAEWLTNLGVPVTLEVGNHDIPYYWAPFSRLTMPYRRYLALERMIEEPLEIAGVTIVPLKTTARAQWRWNWSKGSVSRGALRRTLDLVAQVPAGNLVFVAGHHPLIEGPTRGSAKTKRGDEALAALAEAGVHAVFSGHVHDPFDIPYRHGDWTLRLVGAGTLSRRVRATPPSFNEIRIAGDRFETLVRTQSPEPKHAISETTHMGEE